MKFGVQLPSFSTPGYQPGPGVLADFARQAADLGFDGLWTLEHLLEPTTYNTSWLEPLTCLTCAGAAAPSIDLGTGIMVFPLRNPALLAWRVAGMQFLLGERLKLGVAIGYVKEDYELVAVPMEGRVQRYDEGLEVFSRLLRERNVSHRGRFWQFENATLEPVASKPPEIFIAGGSRGAGALGEIPLSVKRRIAHYDGWISGPKPAERLVGQWEQIAAYARQVGRDPATLGHVHNQKIYVVDTSSREKAFDEQRRAFRFLYNDSRPWESYAQVNHFVGSIDDLLERLSALRRAGVTYVSLGFPTNDPVALREQLVRCRTLLVEPLRAAACADSR